jgi:hypothetical protein
MIALIGTFKGESKAEACHLIPIVAVTKPGLKPKLWVERAVKAYTQLDIMHGWMFRDARGAPSWQKEYKPTLFALIEEVIKNESLLDIFLPRDPDVTAEYETGHYGTQ